MIVFVKNAERAIKMTIKIVGSPGWDVTLVIAEFTANVGLSAIPKGF